MDLSTHYIRDRNRLTAIYFLFYYILLLSFQHDDRLLSEFQPIFLTQNRDLTELALIATGLPRWMMAHPVSFRIADALAFLLPIPLLWQGLRNIRFSILPGIVFVIFLSLYLLLDDIFWQVHHEPFIVFVLLALTWTTQRPEKFYSLLKACRYYFLYIFVSAAIWKIARGAVFNPQEMSRILLFHHTDLLTEPCTTASCRIYRWLIGHPSMSYGLYLAATMLEGCFIVGFFTRRWDRLLIGLAIVFVIADLLVMRIPYWIILVGCFPLWLRDDRRTGEKKMLIYETTHHENLPALLDLSERHFGQVAVFLKALSYHHLTAGASPELRWPRTDFYVQTADCGNRRFLGQLFSFFRRHGYSHLHLATLDNNLLLVALRLIFLDTAHISMTVHEINEYTSSSYRNLRDWSETIAKIFLHRRVRHHHVFLPAMVDELGRRLTGSVAVYIPSRFYSVRRAPGTTPLRPPPYRIVVPGSVDPNRRNYDDISRALALLSSDSGIPAIELVLLGDSATKTGAAVLAALRILTHARLGIRHFSGYIPESTFEEELATAHLLWSPLNIQKKGSRGRPEIYGVSTASGLTADLLLNDIPALVPAGFTIPDPFRSAIYPYRSPEEAAEILRRVIFDAAEFAVAREKIRHTFGYFSKENFGEAFAILTTS